MNKKVDIGLLQAYALNKGGKLLSTEYINSRTKYTWECSKKHWWSTRWNSIQQGKWCPICANNIKTNITVLQEYAKNKGGKLVSTDYKNAYNNLLWECKNTHRWLATWTNINRNKWCKVCSLADHGNKKRLNTDNLVIHANKMNGTLISAVTDYKTNHDKLIWGCNKAHIWSATWNSINSGSWCPECASFKTEKQVKQLLETKLDIIFTKTRFKYNGNRYEFDGYNEEHKIALEYHGEQHYIYPNHWHKTEELFKAAQQRDKDKEQYCKDNDIKLIIIPYTIKDLDNYIITQVIHRVVYTNG